MKRVFSMLCVFALMLGMLAVPAYATDAEGAVQQDRVVLSANAEDLTVEEDTYIDLNGYSIAGVTVKDGATLYVSDSQTDDYTVADGIYGKITGAEGSVEAAQGYVAITEEGAVSYHKADLTLTSMTLRPAAAGVYYNSAFAADEVVAANVECYGVALSVVAEPTAENLDTLCGYSTIYGFEAGEKSGTLLSGIMTQDNTDFANDRNAAMNIYGRAYIKTAEGYTFGTTASRNLKEQVEAIDAIFSQLNEAQSTAILSMYSQFQSVMENWNVPNMKHAAPAGDTVITVPVETEDGEVTETVTVEQDGVTITIPFGTLVDSNELTLSVTRKEQSESGVTAGEGQTLMPFDVHVDGVSAENTQPLTVALGKVMPENLNMGNYTIYHVEEDGTKEMELVASAEELTDHNQFVYTLDGELTLNMANFSEVAALTENDNAWAGRIDYTWYDAAANELYIRNADQLAGLNKIVSGDAGNIKQDSFENKTVKLLSDLNFKDSTWYSIGYWAPGEGANAAGETEWYTYGGGFAGTFDGNGNTVSNISQNTWALNGNYDYGYWDEAMGLFGYVVGGTVKNLTIENFTSDGEFTPTGCVTAFACDSTFENIALVECNPRVYNTGNGGIVGIGGNSDDPDTYKLTFNNITIDNSNKITALWGSWDVACGGLIGMFRGAGHVYMNNCHIAAQIDVYNDVCGNYQYYWYRYSGMLVGTNKNMTTDGNGYTVPETHKFHASECTVHFGTWNNYWYCELVANSLASYTHDHQFSRLTLIDSIADIQDGNGAWTATGNYLVIDGDTKTCYHIVKNADGELVRHLHEDAGYETSIDEDGDGSVDLKEDKQIVYLPFNQLFTGYGWGVKHVPLGEFDGVTILDRLPSSDVKFEDILNKTLAQNKENLVIAENTTLTAGQIFQAAAGVTDIKGDKVQIFVSPADETSTVEAVSFTSTAADWTTGTLQFKGRGKATVTITDNYFCDPTTITVTVGAVNDAAKVMVFTGSDAVEALCPVCASVVTWEALAEKAFTLKETTTENVHNHYYLSADRTYSNNAHYMTSQLASGSKGKTVAMCLNLNGRTLTSSVRALTVDGGRATMNVMGTGTVIGGGMDPTTLTYALPIRGAVDSTGKLNLYGGTYKCTSGVQPVLSLRGSGNTKMYDDVLVDRTETKGLSVFIYEYHTMNMYGGIIQGGDSTDVTFVAKGNDRTRYVYGGNVWIYPYSTKTATWNMYGGTITGGKDTNGGNIYIQGSTTYPDAKTILNLQGGSITDGEVYMVSGTNATLNISGNPVVEELRLASGYKVNVTGELTEGASITFNAAKDAVLSSTIELADPAACGKYVHALADGLDVTVIDNALTVTDHVCPHCDVAYGEIEWIELENTGKQQVLSGANHYRVTETITSSSNTLITEKDTKHDVVVDLNGQTVTSRSGRAFLVYGSGNFALVDSVGGGIVSTSSTNSALGGAVFYATDTIVADIYGGTFLASGMGIDGPKDSGAGTVGNGSCISVYGTGARINIHSATVRGFANNRYTTTDSNGKTSTVYGGVLYNRGKLYIYDIDLDVYVNDTENLSYGIYQYDVGTLYISGGTFDSIGGNENHVLIGADNTTYLYGGEINGTVLTYESSIMSVGYDVQIDELKLQSGHTTNISSLDGANIGVTATPDQAFTKNLSYPDNYMDDFHAKDPNQFIAIKTDAEGNRTLIISNTEPCACCNAVNETIEVTEMTADLAEQMGTLGGHYKLMADVTVTEEIINMSQIALKKNMMLDLNGHTWTSEGGRCFYISNSARLTIRDSGEKVNGEYTGALIAHYGAGGGPVYAAAGCTVDMYGGHLYNNGTPYIGGAVYLTSATFNFHDGVIHGANVTNSTQAGTVVPKGGAIYLTTASGKAAPVFNMYGGKVICGYAEGMGDGIYINSGYVNVYGGTIALGDAGATCSIYASGGYVALAGGTIEGRVYMGKSNRLTLSGNPIVENLDLTNDVTVKLGELTEGASITVKANAGFAFTAANENAANYLQYFEIHESLAETLEITAVENQLVASEKVVESEPETGTETTEPEA